MFSIYIHIPFCIQKCLYCDFLSAVMQEADRESYLEALLTEISVESKAYHNRIVETVFLGGGTPSVLTKEQTGRLLDQLRQCFHIAPDAEITTELNPGTVTKDMLETYRAIGINRLSIGLQSADNAELKLLGRIHTVEEFEECYQMARACGFDNINVDLISALPEQTAASYERTLHRVCTLEPPPEHISAYSLIIEEGTPFYERYGEAAPQACRLPAEEEDRLIYHRTKEILAQYGYTRYEISNYARAGYACRHNEAYWLRTDYVGFGLGAASMVDQVRWQNEPDFKKYISKLREKKPVRQSVEALDKAEQMEEFCFLGLRRMQGISKKTFLDSFLIPIEQVYGDVLLHLQQQGLIDWSKPDEKNGQDRIRLTELGIDVSNYVFAQFLLE